MLVGQLGKLDIVFVVVGVIYIIEGVLLALSGLLSK